MTTPFLRRLTNPNPNPNPHDDLNLNHHHLNDNLKKRKPLPPLPHNIPMMINHHHPKQDIIIKRELPPTPFSKPLPLPPTHHHHHSTTKPLPALPQHSPNLAISPPLIDSQPPPIPVFNILSVDHQDVPLNNPHDETPIPPIAIAVDPPALNLIIHGPRPHTQSPLIFQNHSNPSSTTIPIPPSSPPFLPQKTGPPSSSSDSSLSSLFCAACNHLIAGRVVNALSKRYHPDCFTCEHCNLALEHVAFYEHDGKAYCGVDYDELFSLKCHHCNTSITDESYVTLSDPSLNDGKPRYYHQLHLFCAECGDPFVNPKSLEETSRISKRNTKPIHHHHDLDLVDDFENPSNLQKTKPLEEPKAFVLHKGYAFCEDCHVRLYKPKCWACKKSMVGDILTALGKQWHEGCFKCKGCQHPFLNGLFFLANKQQDPFCETCYSLQLKS